MRGLDAYITGQYSPDAPFNQADICDLYGPVIDTCEWITDEMLDEDETYFKLFDSIEEAWEEATDLEISINDRYLSSKQKYKFMTEHAKRLGEAMKFIYEHKNGGKKNEGTID
jgi:hypothetical protein